MHSLKQNIENAEAKKIAIGHFNISDLVTLRAIFESAQKLSVGDNKVPVIIGLSEGEREFVGVFEAAALVKELRERFDYPIFINADHTHSLEKVKQAVEAGFDAILFDGGKLPLEENIKQTKEVMEYVKGKNENILVEGELGYIGSSSVIFKEIPEGAAINEQTITQVAEATQFVKETGVDLLAPAVGNIHGMFANAPNPHLFINRIREIKQAVQRPLVLHGGSGTPDEDFIAAIAAGVNIIHINTEIRKAWTESLKESLEEHPEEIVPYKILTPVLAEDEKVIMQRLKLFNKL